MPFLSHHIFSIPEFVKYVENTSTINAIMIIIKISFNTSDVVSKYPIVRAVNVVPNIVSPVLTELNILSNKVPSDLFIALVVNNISVSML